MPTPPSPAAAPPPNARPARGGRLPRAEMEERIDRLLGIAAAEFGRHGFGGTSLDRIVARSGVSKTTILRRFGSKEALFRTLIDQTIVRIHAGLATVRLDPDDPEATIVRFIETYVRVAIGDPLGHTLLAIAIMERRAIPRLGAMIVSHAIDGLRPISTYLETLMARGVLGPADPMDAAFDLQGLMTQGFRAMIDDPAFLHRPGRAQEIARRFIRGWS